MSNQLLSVDELSARLSSSSIDKEDMFLALKDAILKKYQENPSEGQLDIPIKIKAIPLGWEFCIGKLCWKI
ncbi:TPA: hypothetical protein QEM49_000380 [Pseudomonas putida]|uniref:hypothetical protein n=1 Tax=Pseudomonas putida TaxID=303 RepID=UPI00236342FD|nr:hypothetical protein [Pseudomonas putida]MDD2009190.1 hypothetical protein [Pseudomonas putida]HDS1775917.1 hypothetical protein [Pseudomonas putida]